MASSITPPALTLAPLPAEIRPIIFGYLQHLIPSTIALLSKSCYETAIPILYETVVISKRNASVAFAGACLDEKTSDKGGYPYGGIDYSSRKAKALAHTKSLVLEDVWAAEALTMCSRSNLEEPLDGPKKQQPLFPSLIHLTLGRQLYLALPPSGIDLDDPAELASRTSHLSSLPNYNEILAQRVGNRILQQFEVDGLLASLAKPKHLRLDWMFAEAEITDADYVYETLWTTGGYMRYIPFTIEWFFYSAEKQLAPMCELLDGNPIQFKFITAPPPGAQIHPEIKQMQKRILELSEDELVKEQAAMVHKIRKRITLESENIMGEEGEEDMIPEEDFVEECEVMFCVQGAEGVAEAWREMEREAVGESLGEEVMERFFEAWEGIFKFTELGEEGDPLERVEKDDGEEEAGGADDW
ncbi:hypothetical protein IAT38_002180 [Cryptococcus sp. DSM 104549]